MNSPTLRRAIELNAAARARWHVRPLAAGIAALTFAALAGAAEPVDEEFAPGRVIELPKFEVTDTRLLPLPEKWHYAEVPGFEILSNISERETKRFVRDFMLLQEAMNVIMPGLRASPISVPTSLILTGRRDAFASFFARKQREERDRTNSLFFHEAERGVIIVDFELPELRLEDNTTLESDPYRSFYKEYFRFVIRRNVGSKPPAWFEEGLVQIFASIDFTKKWINFAMIGDGFGGEKTGDFNRMLQRRALLPMGELFADPPRRRGTFWNAQAYAFVHMCLYGRGQKYQKPFLQFITRLGQESPSEQLFKECFGMDYKKMGIELRGYIEFTDHKYMQFTAKKGKELGEPPPFALRDAPDAVVGRFKGEALRLAGRGDEARNSLIAPYVRGERDPRLLAALGLDELQAGHEDRALKFLEAAANAKVERARAYLELARLRLKAAKTKPAAPDGRLDPNQVSSVLSPLFTARKQQPPMAAVYMLIAETWSLSAARPQSEHLGVLIEGIRVFPRDMALLLQTSLLASERGFPEEARALAERGLKLASTNSDRERFRRLTAALMPPAGSVKSATDPDPVIVTPVTN